MLRNKIYEYIKQYLDKYLFGFDKNQMNMSVLKGNINLKQVNIRPDEANKLIDGLMLPVALKAGMIGNLQIKFSLLSLWNNPIELTIDDFFLILGPNLSFVSHDESYIQDEQLNESYDSTNVFNIFEHELQIKKKFKGKDIDKVKQQQPEDQDEDSLKNNFNNFMKNLKLTIKRLHIRFEDDHFSQSTPFSLGIVIDNFELVTGDSEWSFDSPMDLKFFRVAPPHRDTSTQPNGHVLIIKELTLTNARLYINSMSEMFIPTSLWEQTRYLENQIFDAMPVESLNDLMFQAFEVEDHQTYFMTKFSMFANFYHYKPLQFIESNQRIGQNNAGVGRGLFKMKLLFTEFDLNFTPQMIDDISRLYEFMQNFSISLDLKQYRPQRRPYIINIEKDGVTDIELDEVAKRKKRLLVRDWFFFVVWFVRLRKLLVNFYSEQLIEQEIEQNKEKYEGLLKAAENGKESIKKYIETQSLADKNKENLNTEQQQPTRKWDETCSLYKFQGLNIKIFENYEKYKVQKQYYPSFELKFGNLVIEKNGQSRPQNRSDYSQQSQGFSQQQQTVEKKPTINNQQNNNQSEGQGSFLDYFGLNKWFGGWGGTTTNPKQNEETGRQSKMSSNTFEQKKEDDQRLISYQSRNNEKSQLNYGYNSPQQFTQFSPPPQRNQMSRGNNFDEVNEVMSMGTPNLNRRATNNNNQFSQFQKQNQIRQGNNKFMSNYNPGVSQKTKSNQAFEGIQMQWKPNIIELQSNKNFVLCHRQFCHFKNSQGFGVNSQAQAAIQITTKQNIAILQKGMNKKIDYQIKTGQLIFEYSNDILKNLCDTIVQYKKLYAFRYVPLKNLFQNRENIHRKIELHAPLYLIKKIFVSSGSSNRPSSIFKSPSQKDNSILNQNMKGETQKIDMNFILHKKGPQQQSQKVGKMKLHDMQSDDDNENENISEDEDIDKVNSRFNIQAAVSSKDPFKVSSKGQNKNYIKDQELEKQMKQQMKNESDQQLLRSIIDYEQLYKRSDINFLFDLSEVQIYLVPSDMLRQSKESQYLEEINYSQGGAAGGWGICKLMIKQNQIELYKNQNESGFNAFGIQFQSVNKFQMYFYFIKSLKKALETYTSHPVFEQSSNDYFDRLRFILRQNLKIQKFNDRETMQNVFGLKNQNDQFQMVKNNGLTYNENGVAEQQNILGKGSKTGVKTGAHYNILFNNLTDRAGPEGSTNRFQDEDLLITQKSKAQNSNLGIKIAGEDYSPPGLLNLSSEGNQHNSIIVDHDQDKDREKNQLIRLIGTQTPLINDKRTDTSINSPGITPQSFLGGVRIKQEVQQNFQSQQNAQTQLKNHQEGNHSLSQGANFKIQGKKKPTDKQSISNTQNIKKYQINEANSLYPVRGKSQQFEEEVLSETNNKTKVKLSQLNSGSSTQQQQYQAISGSEDEHCQEKNDNESIINQVTSKIIKPTVLKKTSSNNSNGAFPSKPFDGQAIKGNGASIPAFSKKVKMQNGVK